MSSDLMAAVTICSAFRAQEEEICHSFHLSPSICHEVMGPWVFFSYLVLSWLFHCCSFTLDKRLFSSSSLSAISVVSSSYLRLFMFLLPILISACNSPSLAFLIMSSPCRLNKQGDSSQPCCTPFSILNQSVVPYRELLLLDPHTGYSGDR